MSGLVSDEVAEDYKNSLEDLTSNDKFQISNLTVIAKENTEHAMAISRVLENHIRNVGTNSLSRLCCFLLSPLLLSILSGISRCINTLRCWIMLLSNIGRRCRNKKPERSYILIDLCRHHHLKSYQLSM